MPAKPARLRQCGQHVGDHRQHQLAALGRRQQRREALLRVANVLQRHDRPHGAIPLLQSSVVALQISYDSGVDETQHVCGELLTVGQR